MYNLSCLQAGTYLEVDVRAVFHARPDLVAETPQNGEAYDCTGPVSDVGMVQLVGY